MLCQHWVPGWWWGAEMVGPRIRLTNRGGCKIRLAEPAHTAGRGGGLPPLYGPTDCIITQFMYLSGQRSRRWPCLLCFLLSQSPHGCLEEGCPLLILRRWLWFSSSPDQGGQSGFQEFSGAWGEDGGKNQEGSVSILTGRSSVLLLWQMTPKWTPKLVQVWFPLT